MKKILVLMLVLAVGSLASATVVDVVLDGPGSLGNAGTVLNPLVAGETINVKLVLNTNLGSHPSYASYDGYALDGHNLDISTTNTSAIGIDAAAIKKGAWNGFAVDIAGTQYGYSLSTQPTLTGTTFFTGDMGGNVTFGVGTLANTVMDIMWGYQITADGTADIAVDLAIGGAGSFYRDFINDGFVNSPAIALLDADLGDLIIYAPEPMTMALLGLGGLFLRRRKK